MRMSRNIKEVVAQRRKLMDEIQDALMPIVERHEHLFEPAKLAQYKDGLISAKSMLTEYIDSTYEPAKLV